MTEEFNPQIGNPQLQQASKKLEIGWMGFVFGDAAEKPGNIAGIAIIAAFVMLAFALFLIPANDAAKNQALTLFGSIITGALGFLFGRRSQ